MSANHRPKPAIAAALLVAVSLTALVAVATRATPGGETTIHLPIIPRNDHSLEPTTLTPVLSPTTTATGTLTAAVPQTATATATQTATTTATQTMTATATQTATATATTPAATCPCHADVRNCSDFDNQAEAQACFEHCLALTGRDVHRLDGNSDCIACNSLSCPCATPSTCSYSP